MTLREKFLTMMYVVLISFGALLKLWSVVLLIKTTDCQISLCKACLVFSE